MSGLMPGMVPGMPHGMMPGFMPGLMRGMMPGMVHFSAAVSQKLELASCGICASGRSFSKMSKSRKAWALHIEAVGSDAQIVQIVRALQRAQGWRHDARHDARDDARDGARGGARDGARAVARDDARDDARVEGRAERRAAGGKLAIAGCRSCRNPSKLSMLRKF